MLSLPEVLLKLRHLGIKSLMVEGGARIIDSFLQAALVHTLIITVAPTLVGADGIAYSTPIAVCPFSLPSQSLLNLSLLEPPLPTRRYSGGWYRCCYHSQTYMNINPICTFIPTTTTTTDHRKLPHNHSSAHSSQILPLTSQPVPKLLHLMMEYSQVNLYPS